MSQKEAAEMLELLFRQARMQFGSAITSYWFHDRDGCPGCGHEVKGMKYKGQNALSLNAFIYREHGVLIGYLLCTKCAKYVLKKSKKDPHGTTPLHGKIEENLKQAYISHLGH